MGSANSTLVLTAIDAWDRGDKDALLRCFDPDFEFVLSGQILDQPLRMKGHEEYSRFFDTWLASWETFTFTAARIADLGGQQVLVKTVQHAVSRDGIGVDRTVWFVANVADGVIVRYRAFTDENAAFEAAGIAAWPPDAQPESALRRVRS